MPFFVYIVLNPDGKTYVGQTADLDRRLAQHTTTPIPG
jgi:predicted GIY-YIG superfamily endonuclease